LLLEDVPQQRPGVRSARDDADLGGAAEVLVLFHGRLLPVVILRRFRSRPGRGGPTSRREGGTVEEVGYRLVRHSGCAGPAALIVRSSVLTIPSPQKTQRTVGRSLGGNVRSIRSRPLSISFRLLRVSARDSRTRRAELSTRRHRT